MLSATVYVLILALGSAVVVGQFVNNYDEDARIECPKNQIFSFIGSMHNNRFEDRRWQFQCRPAPGVTTGCHWSSYVNEFDEPLIFACPANEVLNGMMSIHNSQHEDRRFMMQCCNVPGTSTRNCHYTGFVHEYDREMNFFVASGQAIKGAFSVHDNDKEDRRWKFNVCDLD